MGCCHAKQSNTSGGPAKQDQWEEDGEDTEEVDADSSDHRNRNSTESLLITVLWRRLSMFSRRGSSRTGRKRSSQNQKLGCTLQESNPEKIKEEPEKG